MQLKSTIYLAIVFLLFSLVPLLSSSEAQAKIYEIKKGNHYSSQLRLGAVSNRSFKFEALFNNTAIYQTVDPKNQGDTNKLYGFADCGDHHMTNSARFGWRWLNNQLEIMAFVHRDGKFYFHSMGPAQLNRAYDYQIKLSEDNSEYLFIFNGEEVRMERGCQTEKFFGYISGPYFGGDETAPHDISIRVERRKEIFGDFAVEQNYPNPVTGTTKIPLTMYASDDIAVLIYDVAGRLVRRFPDSDFESFDAGENQEIEIDLSDLASAMYIYQIVNREGLSAVTPDNTKGMKLLKI